MQSQQVKQQENSKQKQNSFPHTGLTSPTPPNQEKPPKTQDKPPKVLVRLKDLEKIKKKQDQLHFKRFYRKLLNKRVMKRRSSAQMIQASVAKNLSYMVSTQNNSTIAGNTISNTLTQSPKNQGVVSISDTLNTKQATPITRPDTILKASSYYRDEFHYQSRLGRINLSISQNQMQRNKYLDTITMSRKIDQQEQ